MATKNIVINYPDGAGNRITTALKAYYNVTTNAEAFAAFEQEVKDTLKARVRAYEDKVATETAKSSVTEAPIS